MTDFLNPIKWTEGDTSCSPANLNYMAADSAATRILADYTGIAVSQPTDLADFLAKMKRYCFVFTADLPVNTDFRISFPAPKDNTDYGVAIVWRNTAEHQASVFGWGGTTRNNTSLNVMSRDLNSVTVRYQKNWDHGTDAPGSSYCPVLVTVFGGINF